ncbi:DUF262 domain-containing protein [Flavobacterium sp. DGU11]|uniref:DUF262 domain-containing protein n=1 Tax=Flavobacterium arundinis TaxID=3139143 RepID=A0ABU9HRS8_9FLAO
MEEEFEIYDDTISENEEFRYSITSYGADYTLDSVVNRIETEKIFVPPFQRQYVWTNIQASRFIESLILGLPVPGVFLSKENETGRLLIVDGQQRMLSIANFYKGVFGEKKFRLKNVQPDLEGLTYDTLKEADRNRLDDSILHATIIKQETPDDDESSIYMVFERLNTGGTPLQPQEIRACIYYGPFNEFLSELVEFPAWRQIFGVANRRMKEQELILRFFTLYYHYSEYKKVLKSSLNQFMGTNRKFERYPQADLEYLFTTTISTIYSALGSNAFRIGNRLNAAIFDSVMIGVAKRLVNNSSPIDSSRLKEEYDTLILQPAFLSYVQSGTSSEASVKGRISMSIEAFNSI